MYIYIYLLLRMWALRLKARTCSGLPIARLLGVLGAGQVRVFQLRDLGVVSRFGDGSARSLLKGGMGLSNRLYYYGLGDLSPEFLGI